MDNNQKKSKENILAGAVGAFLFSLVGGILWFVLYQFGYLASISGLIGVICAVKGYTFFAKTKNESKVCLILSVVIAVIVLAIAWLLCIAYDIYLVYQEWFAAGEVDFTLNFFESVRAIPLFLSEGEILVAYLKDLGLGLIFAIIGIVSYLSSREKRMKRIAAEEAAAKAQSEVYENTDTTAEHTEQNSIKSESSTPDDSGTITQNDCK